MVDKARFKEVAVLLLREVEANGWYLEGNYVDYPDLGNPEELHEATKYMSIMETGRRIQQITTTDLDDPLGGRFKIDMR